MTDFIRNTLSPAALFDALVVFLFRINQPWLADGLMCWFRGTHRLQYIRFQTSRGVRLWLNPLNYIDRLLLTQGDHDPEVTEALQASVKPGDVVWDVGANIGLMSFNLLQKDPTLQIVAFEPSPFTFAQLYLNNGLHGGKVRIAPLALSDHDGAGTFSVKVNRNSGMSTLRRDSRFNYDFDIQVLCVRGESLVENGSVPGPNVIKLDVEGAELPVLAGMGRALDSAGLRTIIFEGPTVDHAEILDLLNRKGFTSLRKLNSRKFTNFIASRA